MKYMADIQIVQEHNLSPERARAAAQQVADKVAAEFGMQWRWEGDVLRFFRQIIDMLTQLKKASLDDELKQKIDLCINIMNRDLVKEGF